MDHPLGSHPADALAQPTRARLFALLGELRRAASTSELAEHVRMHPNGVRLHLERLEHEGLVTRARVRHGRGRPRDVWAIAPDARPAPSTSADLGPWLARAMRSPSGGVEGVEATGREIGRELAPHGAVRDALPAALATLGFEPRVARDAGDRLTLSLEHCPYREAVRENPEVVCALHRGITRGVLDVTEPAARLDGFVPKDPDKAGCLVEIADLKPAR